MDLQAKTLERYKTFFPKDTLKETSRRTGIHVTRIFRLYNGKTMKVSELEKFESAIRLATYGNPNLIRLEKLIEESSKVLTNEEVDKLINWIERKNKTRAFGRSLFSTNNSAYIA